MPFVLIDETQTEDAGGDVYALNTFMGVFTSTGKATAQVQQMLEVEREYHLNDANFRRNRETAQATAKRVSYWGALKITIVGQADHSFIWSEASGYRWKQLRLVWVENNALYVPPKEGR